MVSPSVFHYQDSKQFLRDWLSARQKIDSSFSVRKLAKTMEISHALLLMILQGKRSLKLKHLTVLNRGLHLPQTEKNYFQALIEFENAKTNSEKESLALWLRDLNPNPNFSLKIVDEFKSISSWVHMAILACSGLKKKINDPEEFVRRFKHKVNAQEIRSAVTRLEMLGYLKRDGDGSFQAVYQKLSTANDVVNEAVKTYHQKVSHLAAEMIEEQSVLEREFQSFALPIDLTKLPLAKEMIRKFRNDFYLAMKSDEATEVYHVNLQLFRLTERSPVMAQVEDESVDKTKTPSSVSILNKVESEPKGELCRK